MATLGGNLDGRVYIATICNFLMESRKLKLDSMDDKEFLSQLENSLLCFISSPALTRKVLTRERGPGGDHKVFPFLAVRAIVYWLQDWTVWLTRVGILAQHQITGIANIPF